MPSFTPAVIAAAQKSQKDWGVPASVSLAQWALESAYGTRIPSGSNNFFGVKAVGDQPFVATSTHETIKGKDVVIQTKFRKFNSIDESFSEHGKLLARAPVYAQAMAAWKAGDLEGGIKLMAAYYATSPTYASALLSIVNDQNLRQFDNLPAVAPNAVPVSTAPVAPKPNLLETIKMDISLWTMVTNAINLLPYLRQDISTEVKVATSTEDGKAKALQTIAVIEDMCEQAKAVLNGKPVPAPTAVPPTT